MPLITAPGSTMHEPLVIVPLLFNVEVLLRVKTSVMLNVVPPATVS